MFKIIYICLMVVGLGAFFPAYAQKTPPKVAKLPIDYQAKDYSSLLGMPGFSDPLLNMHFELYKGYVKNSNQLLSLIQNMTLHGKESSLEWAGLKRRLGWELDGMRLHELYFENLGGREPINKSSLLYARIVKDFGSYDQWKRDFVATGMMRGIGWVILYKDPQNGRLINMWVQEHDMGHLAGGTLILVMDVFEHAYITQFALDKGKYIDAFFDNILWEEAVNRYIK